MKILVADDHPLFRAGIRHALVGLEDNVEVLEADDYAQAAELAASHGDITLALLDLCMPSVAGVDGLATLINSYPALPIVVLSADENRDVMQRAFDVGAVGFIHKSTALKVLLGALRLVLEGGKYIPPVFLEAANSGSNDAELGGALTQRQSDVMAGILEGKPNKTIARELGLTEATVKAHVAALFKTLKVNSRTQAVLTINKLGLSRE